MIVVLNTSTTIAFADDDFPSDKGWADEVDAILQMWFTGQAGGTATANLLLGNANPSGSLPMTFPKRSEDTLPSYSDDILIQRADGTRDKWVVAEGERTIYVGDASDNLLLEDTVDVEARLVQKPYIEGYNDGTFGGRDPITRSEFSKMVVALTGLDELWHGAGHGLVMPPAAPF